MNKGKRKIVIIALYSALNILKMVKMSYKLKGLKHLIQPKLMKNLSPNFQKRKCLRNPMK